LSDTLLEQLKKTEQLPTAPGIALRIIELNRQEDVDIDELSTLLAQDPALTAKVIKAANSTIFGVRREVTSVRRAVMILGLRTVNLLALSFSVISISSGRAPGGFDYRRFWTQTAATAACGRLIADRVAQKSRDEAFLAGLLCDFGQLVLAECAPKVYAPVLDSWTGSSRSVLEVEAGGLGISHPEIGAQLLMEWGLPKRVCRAIAAHHGAILLPDDDPELKTLTQVVQLATLCGEILSGGDLAVSVPELQRLGGEYFNLDGAACSAILTELQEKLPVAAQMLDLEMDELPLAELRKTATELLLRESLALQQQISVVAGDAQLLKLQSDLEERVQTDALTGLKNRGYFDGHLAAVVVRARSENGSIGLLIVDIDHFKRVNDEYGHPTGDELLRRCSAAIRASAGPEDACCRYGGEEFAIVCRGVTEESLLARAEQIRQAIGAVSLEVPNGTLRRTASVGGCVLRGDATPQQLLERADRQLYRAKAEGRDCCFVTTLD